MYILIAEMHMKWFTLYPTFYSIHWSDCLFVSIDFDFIVLSGIHVRKKKKSKKKQQQNLAFVSIDFIRFCRLYWFFSLLFVSYKSCIFCNLQRVFYSTKTNFNIRFVLFSLNSLLMNVKKSMRWSSSIPLFGFNPLTNHWDFSTCASVCWQMLVVYGIVYVPLSLFDHAIYRLFSSRVCLSKLKWIWLASYACMRACVRVRESMSKVFDKWFKSSFGEIELMLVATTFSLFSFTLPIRWNRWWNLRRTFSYEIRGQIEIDSHFSSENSKNFEYTKRNDSKSKWKVLNEKLCLVK